MLIPLYSLYLRICLLQAGPEQVPHSMAVFGLSLGGALLVTWLSALGLEGTGLWVGWSQILAVGGVLWVLLNLFDHAARWLQVASAVFGCGAILNGFALPFLWMLPAETSGWQALIWLSVFGLGMWNFVVIVRILRAAFESGFGLAVGMAMLLQLAPLVLHSLMVNLIGPAGPGG